MDAAVQHSAPAEPAPAFRFDLFISYASVPDARLVRALEKFLEGFHRVKLPGNESLRPLQVCVDGTDFALRRMPRVATSAMVEDVVEQALDTYLAQSRLLLVCCSSGAVRSRYVAHEIEWFLEQKRESDILLAVCEGADPTERPEEVFPAALIQRGLHKEFWFDLRGWHWWKRRRWRYVRNFDEACVRLAADVSGVPLNTVYPPWWRAERRRRLRMAAAAAVAAVLIATASTVAVSKMWDAWKSRLKADSQGVAATATALLRTDPELSGLLARAAHETAPTEAADDALRAAAGASRIQASIEVPGARTVRQVAWSSDGTRFVTVAAVGKAASRVQVWQVGDGATARPDGPPLAVSGIVTAATFSPRDSDAILTVERKRGAQLWQRRITSWRRGRILWQRSGAPLPHQGVAQTAAFDPTGQWIAVGEAVGGSLDAIRIWSVGGSRVEPQHVLNADAAPEILAFDATGERLAWATNGGVSTWTAKSGPALLFTSTEAVRSLEFASDGHLVAAVGRGVEVWRPGVDRADSHLIRSAEAVRAVAVRPQGNLVAVALDDGTIPILSLAGGAEVVTLRGPAHRVNHLAFAPDGHSLLTGSADNRARLWSLEPNAVQAIEHQDRAADVAFSADGSYLASADKAAYQTRIWNPRIGLVRDLQADLGGPTAVAFSPSPSQPCALVVGAADRTAQVWDICTGDQGATLGPLAGEPTRVAVDPTGTRALLASASEVRVMTMATNDPVTPMLSLDGRLLAAGFAADGNTAIVVTDRSARLLPLRPDATPQLLPADATISAAALSADRRVLALAVGRIAHRFDTANGRLLSSDPVPPTARLLALDAHGRRGAVATDDAVELFGEAGLSSLSGMKVTALAFDPSGELLVIAEKGGTLSVRSIEDGTKVTAWQFGGSGGAETDRVAQLLFSPDGAYLVARGNGPVARVYGREQFRPLPEVMALLERRVTRTLKDDERSLYLQARGRWWWP